ncbi:hypothetical protein [Saccharothrix longispora]|uniref:hypothetical protein n=1 Tax=Saccharothrix longispora TaxID=33920 RepID=UPI0028FD97EF|nr:hypothetical protein [Saccharothrix longispora]MBY8851574.1 hypothetical protein [Saccharothrix sp. MB29]MDU0291205.1 hypothetical protein [Saccharothrix longispora]
MSDPVVRWSTGRDSLADVVVCAAAGVDGREVTAFLREVNPFAALLVAVSPALVVVRTEFDDVVELRPAGVRARCLGHEGTVLSVARSFYAWHVSRLDLRALARRGLPVWCGRHREVRSAVACGWLGVATGSFEPLGDLGRS